MQDPKYGKSGFAPSSGSGLAPAMQNFITSEREFDKKSAQKLYIGNLGRINGQAAIGNMAEASYETEAGPDSCSGLVYLDEPAAPGDDQYYQPEEAEEVMLAAMNRPRGPKPGDKCFSCGKIAGHWAGECPLKQKMQNMNLGAIPKFRRVVNSAGSAPSSRGRPGQAGRGAFRGAIRSASTASRARGKGAYRGNSNRGGQQKQRGKYYKRWGPFNKPYYIKNRSGRWTPQNKRRYGNKINEMGELEEEVVTEYYWIEEVDPEELDDYTEEAEGPEVIDLREEDGEVVILEEGEDTQQDF